MWLKKVHGAGCGLQDVAHCPALGSMMSVMGACRLLLSSQPLQPSLQNIGADQRTSADVQDFRAGASRNALVEVAPRDTRTTGGFILGQNIKAHAAPIRTTCNEG